MAAVSHWPTGRTVTAEQIEAAIGRADTRRHHAPPYHATGKGFEREYHLILPDSEPLLWEERIEECAY